MNEATLEARLNALIQKHFPSIARLSITHQKNLTLRLGHRTDIEIDIVPELSRLGRSMLEIMEILAIAREKGISIYSVKGGWELNNSIQSKVMAMAFSIAAEIERDLICVFFANKKNL